MMAEPFAPATEQEVPTSPVKLEGEKSPVLSATSTYSSKDEEDTASNTISSLDTIVDASVHERGLSGFLEYRKLNGTWRRFLFQTTGHQLIVYKVYLTHQMTVITADITEAGEISLIEEEGATLETTRLFQFGINESVIVLRACSHEAAVHWVEGLKRLRDGLPLEPDPTELETVESEDDLYREIDEITYAKEYPDYRYLAQKKQSSGEASLVNKFLHQQQPGLEESASSKFVCCVIS